MQKRWKELRGSEVMVRYWGNDVMKFSIYINSTGCDCTSFFETDILGGGPEGAICRRTLEIPD